MALPGRDKALILLSILGGEASTRVMQFLSPEAADQIAGEINHLPTPSPEGLQEILEEAQVEMEGGMERGAGLLPQTREVPSMPRMTAASSSADRVRRLVVNFTNERPPVLAFVAAGLSPEERELFLSEFPDRRREIERLLPEYRQTSLADQIRASILS